MRYHYRRQHTPIEKECANGGGGGGGGFITRVTPRFYLLAATAFLPFFHANYLRLLVLMKVFYFLFKCFKKKN